MSNQPDKPQPYVPPGYNSPPVPPYVEPVAPAVAPAQEQDSQPQYTQEPYAQPVQQEQYGEAQYQQAQNQQAQYQQKQNAQQQYQQPPQFTAPTYYQGGPGYPGAVGPKGLSMASMVVGIVSLVLFGFFIVPQIVGIILGHMGLKRENPQGRGFAISGLVMNYLALVIYGTIVGIWIALLLTLGTSSSSSSYS